jgi:hypothetical protein
LNPSDGEDLSGWTHSIPVRLNTTATGAGIHEDVIGFPVLIRLNADNFPFDQVSEGLDGADIRFTDARGAALPFEIENWDSVGSKAQIWVGMDTVYGNRNDQTLNILFGKKDVFSAASPHAVFNPATGVNTAWHFSMYNPGGILSDATVNGNWLRMGRIRKESGLTGQAWTLAPGDELGSSPTASQQPASLSLSAWFRPKGQQTLSRLIWKHRRGESAAAYSVTWLGGERLLEFSLADGAAPSGSVFLRADVPAGTDWIHFAATFDAKAKTAALYVGGKLAATLPVAGPIDYRSAGDLMLGSQPGGINGYQGAIDEIRLYHTVWSSARVALEYQNLKPGANWVVFPPR